MTVKLEWQNETDDIVSAEQMKLLEQLLQLAAEAEEEADIVVSLCFVDDAAIRQMNKQYRNIDQATDVLSFSMRESTEDELEIQLELDEMPASEELLGDIIISMDTAKAQSEMYGHSLEREVGFLFIHGFLHLLGYDHQDEMAEKIMLAKQEQILEKAGLSR